MGLLLLCRPMWRKGGDTELLKLGREAGEGDEPELLKLEKSWTGGPEFQLQNLGGAGKSSQQELEEGSSESDDDEYMEDQQGLSDTASALKEEIRRLDSLRASILAAYRIAGREQAGVSRGQLIQNRTRESRWLGLGERS